MFLWMVKVLTVVLFAVLALSACNAPPRMTPIAAPNGQVGYLVECGEVVRRCIEAANAQCPQGYVIADRGQETIGVFVYPRYGVVNPNTRNSLVILCE